MIERAHKQPVSIPCHGLFWWIQMELVSVLNQNEHNYIKMYHLFFENFTICASLACLSAIALNFFSLDKSTPHDDNHLSKGTLLLLLSYKWTIYNLTNLLMCLILFQGMPRSVFNATPSSAPTSNFIPASLMICWRWFLSNCDISWDCCMEMSVLSLPLTAAL